MNKCCVVWCERFLYCLREGRGIFILLIEIKIYAHIIGVRLGEDLDDK